MHFSNFSLSLLLLPTWSAIAAQQNMGSYVAMGDSYASGNGAGSPGLLDLKCGRFSGAYPNLIAERLGLRRSWWGGYSDVACAGATTHSVKWKQLLSFRYKEFGTLQIGGNEADFFAVLNECVQQWHPISTCDKELKRAQSLIQSPELAYSFHHMVEHAMYRRSRLDTHLLVLGYATFFNEDTEQCNNVTFSYTNPVNILSHKLRRDLNTLVRMLNKVIKDGAEAHGAIYVDIDQAFEGHRFCERGVDEPRADWTGTWFFREAPRSSMSNMGWTDSYKSMTSSAISFGDAQKQITSRPATTSVRFLELTRTFHPTIEGHKAIAERVLEVLESFTKTE